MSIRRTAQFVEGWLTVVRMLGGERYVWWGRYESGEDYIGTVGGRVAAYETADELIALARLRGWDRNAHLEVDDGSLVDVGPAQAWVRGRGPLHPDAAINLWNFAEDVLRSTSGEALTSDPETDSLHAHLTATALPYLSRDGELPAWSAHQLKRLRSVLDRADRILEDGLLTPPA